MRNEVRNAYCANFLKVVILNVSRVQIMAPSIKPQTTQIYEVRTYALT